MSDNNDPHAWISFLLFLVLVVLFFGYQSTTIEYSEFETHQYDVIAYYPQDDIAICQDANGTYHKIKVGINEISQSDDNIIIEKYRYKSGWLYATQKEWLTHTTDMYINSSVIDAKWN